MISGRHTCDPSSVRHLYNFSKGNSPLIIETPHGGTMDICMESVMSCAHLQNFGLDENTIEVSNELADRIRKLSNGRVNPTLVSSNVRRDQINVTALKRRSHKEDPFADCVYDTYHEVLSREIGDNIHKFGKSLIVSIHGFEQFTLPKGFNDGVEIFFGTQNLKSVSSEDNVREKLIRKMMDARIPTTPHHPKGMEYKLRGGDLTMRYGGKGASQAVQMELSTTVRSLDDDLKKRVLDNIAEVLIEEVL